MPTNLLRLGLPMPSYAQLDLHFLTSHFIRPWSAHTGYSWGTRITINHWLTSRFAGCNLSFRTTQYRTVDAPSEIIKSDVHVPHWESYNPNKPHVLEPLFWFRFNRETRPWWGVSALASRPTKGTMLPSKALLLHRNGYKLGSNRTPSQCPQQTEDQATIFSTSSSRGLKTRFWFRDGVHEMVRWVFRCHWIEDLAAPSPQTPWLFWTLSDSSTRPVFFLEDAWVWTGPNNVDRQFFRCVVFSRTLYDNLRYRFSALRIVKIFPHVEELEISGLGYSDIPIFTTILSSLPQSLTKLKFYFLVTDVKDAHCPKDSLLSKKIPRDCSIFCGVESRELDDLEFFGEAELPLLFSQGVLHE